MSTDQRVFEFVYRGRQRFYHHLAYMRMGKVLLALRAIRRLGLDLRGRSLFDYGFGAGTLFRYCPTECALFGVEQDQANVLAVSEMLRERGHPKVDLRAVAIDTWASHPLLDRTYDLFVCSHVLEHLPEPAAFLQEVRRCIGPGGRFLGLVPLNEIGRNPHHLWQPDRAMIHEWARASRFTVEYYEENDPWLYWLQPLFTTDHPGANRLPQLLSLALGLPATLTGPALWFVVGRLFGLLTGSRPTQAVFALKVQTT